MAKDFYETLGVNKNASEDEIKRAYRKLVKSYHPDLEQNGQTCYDSQQATERMMHLNEAYETLKDKAKRAAYDRSIGISYATVVWAEHGSYVEEDAAREMYLKRVFHPYRQGIFKVLNMYQRQLAQLSLDIYDDELVKVFQDYCDDVEVALCNASDAFAKDHGPCSLEAAVQMMLYAIARAADGLDELRCFCQNYDYNHLTVAANLFAIAQDLSRQSLRLTKS